MDGISRLVRGGAEITIRTLTRFADHSKGSLNRRAETLRHFADRAELSAQRGENQIAAARLPDGDSTRGDSHLPALPVRRRPGPAELRTKQIGAELTERHGFPVYGFERQGVDRGTARDIVSAMNDMLAKYPLTRVMAVEISSLANDRDIAQAASGYRSDSREDRATTIFFSTRHATNPALLLETVSEAVGRKHFKKSPAPPAYAMVVHEFGHALTFEGHSRAVEKADSHLRDHFLRKHGDELSDIESEGAYLAWRDQLSGYSFSRGRFHPMEALAEAFADVELNGSAASEPAKVLHELLVSTAQEQWRKEGLL